MPRQRSTATDLDIVGVRADCEDASLLLLATVTHSLREQQGLLHEPGRCHGFEEQAIDAAFDGLPHELRALIMRDYERCEPAAALLDPLQAVEVDRQGWIGDDQIPVPGSQQAHSRCNVGGIG